MVYYCALDNAYLFQDPTPILLGKKWEWVVEQGERTLSEVKHYGYTIDLFKGLKVCIINVISYHSSWTQALLSNPSVKEEVFQSHSSGDGVLRDFCDGHFVRQNKIFQAHKDALQLVLYYDDIEVAKPRLEHTH